MLNACTLSGEWKGVSWVFEELRKSGLKPSGATYGLAMEVYLQGQICKKPHFPHFLYTSNNMDTVAVVVRASVSVGPQTKTVEFSNNECINKFDS